MKDYVMSSEEREYLAAYNISNYDRPSIAADMAVFSIMEQREESIENYRKDPEKVLKLLLIRRATFPYRNYWALPGGFCRKGESVLETARRELEEETGVADAYLRLFDIFSEKDRDPRGWIISQAFLALIEGGKYKVHEGTDAWEAKWFQVTVKKEEVSKEIKGEKAVIENNYFLCLECAEREELKLTAKIKECKSFHHYHETVSYHISNTDGIAFDHAKIILCAWLTLQKETGDTGKIIFDLMPEAFTMAELQKAYEIVQGKPLIVANFRRKMAEYVVETKEVSEGAGHRPAKLFKRNIEAFYK